MNKVVLGNIWNDFWSRLKRFTKIILDSLKGVWNTIFWPQSFWDDTNLLPIERINRRYVFLTIFAWSLLIIDIVLVLAIEHIAAKAKPILWLLIPPAVVLAIFVFITILMGYKRDLTIVFHGSKSQCSARLGNILGALVPVIACLFWYLPFYALPHYRTVQWTITYHNAVDGLEAPPVIFSLLYDPDRDPLLDVTSQCSLTQNPGGRTGSSRPEPIDCYHRNVSGRWSYGFMVNLTDRTELGLKDEFIINLNLTAHNPANLRDGSGGIITLSYILIDGRLDLNEAFDSNQRYPFFSPYPWYTANYAVANIEQETIEDPVASIITEGPREYRTYKVDFSPGALIDQNNSCFNTTPSSSPCTQRISLQVSPETLLTTWRKSGYGINRGTMILDEGAIVGGVMLLQFFFALYEK